MSNKMKKVVGFLISTVMIFSLCIGVSQNTQAAENMDPVEFIGATEIGNTKWTDPGNHSEYNVYLNDTGKFVNENSKVPANRITDTMVLEPVSAIAGVDTMATSGWSVSGETVTINNLNVNAEDYAEFCIYSGDKDAGYGKGLAKLVVKGNCYVKTLVIDCPVEVTCEVGAKLVVGELVVNTADEANGKLTYTSGTTYDATTKTFEVSRTHTTHTWDAGTVTTVATCKTKGVKTFKCTVEGCTETKTEEIAIDANNHVNTEVLNAKDATCTEKGYTGDTHCKDCDTTVTGTDIAATGHKWDSGKVTKEPTVSAEGVKTFTCVNSGCNETKTEAIAKLPEPKKNEVIEDKTGNDYKVTAPEKKEVSYKAPASKKAKTVTIPASVTIDGVTYKVTKIDDNAFKGNTTVTKITIPSTVTTIGKDAFNGCKKLKTVSVPKNVTEIGKNAFKGCAALTKVTLPSKCTKIGANAFDGCKKMKTITIKSTKLTSKSIASGAFKGLSKNVTIKVPKKQLKAYKKLLKKKGFKGKVKA